MAIYVVYITSLLCALFALFPSATYANGGGGGAGGYFRQLEQLFMQEQGALATRILTEDLAGGTDVPKEISIHCPGTPEVSIRDLLHDEAMMHGDNTCMVLNLSGPNFSLKLAVNCDGEAQMS